MSAGVTAATAAAAAVVQALKASGGIVHIKPSNFLKLLRKVERPLVVRSEEGFFSTSHRYLTSYKGIFFFTKSPQPVPLPSQAEIVAVEKIWIPG